MMSAWHPSRAWPGRKTEQASVRLGFAPEGRRMTSIDRIEVDPVGDRPAVIAAATRRKRTRVAPMIAMALILLPVNVGILLYTAKNAAELEEGRDSLAALRRSIDGLKQQIDKQARSIAKGSRTEDIAVIRKQTEALRDDVMALSGQLRSGFFATGGRVIMSAPGKEPAQHFETARHGEGAQQELSEESLATVAAQGVSLANLPRYERSVSSEGKLILRKVQ